MLRHLVVGILTPLGGGGGFRTAIASDPTPEEGVIDWFFFAPDLSRLGRFAMARSGTVRQERRNFLVFSLG